MSASPDAGRRGPWAQLSVAALLAAALATAAWSAPAAGTAKVGEAVTGACERAGMATIAVRSGPTLCTHGDDHDLDEISAAVAGSGGRPEGTAAATRPIACNGTGSDGRRVQVLYARAADQPDRYASVSANLQQMVGGIDAIFQDSAARNGGDRQVRWLTDASCRPVIDNVVLSAQGDDDFDRTISELIAKGYGRDDRKYVVFMDTDQGGICGIGTLYLDDGASSGNANDNTRGYSRVDRGCWTAEVAAHELMHNLGAVQQSAPHASANLHCRDDYDLMCYDDGGGAPAIVCTSPADDRLFDCRHDDYFATNPVTGSYVATHWNTANSRWLTKPAGLIRGVVTGPTGAPRAGVWVSVVDIDAARVRPLGASTDSNGQWAIDAGPGRFVVTYFDQSGALRYEYHDNRLYFSEGYDFGRVATTPGGAVSITASMANWSPALRTGDAGLLGGVRTAAGAAVPGVWVIAVDASGVAVKGAIVQSNGLFAMGGLPAGTYRLLLTDPTGTYRFEWSENGYSFQTATPVTAPAGRYGVADTVLAPY